MHDIPTPPPSSAATRWRGHVAEQQKSCLSVREYCAARGLAAPTFYEWRRRLSTRPAFVPVEVVPPRPCERGGEAGVELLLASGHRLRLGRGFDREVLLAAVSALGEARPC